MQGAVEMVGGERVPLLCTQRSAPVVYPKRCLCGVYPNGCPCGVYPKGWLCGVYPKGCPLFVYFSIHTEMQLKDQSDSVYNASPKACLDLSEFSRSWKLTLISLSSVIRILLLEQNGWDAKTHLPHCFQFDSHQMKGLISGLLWFISGFFSLYIGDYKKQVQHKYYHD